MITYRFAERDDIPVILSLVRALAAYEHMEDAVVATPALYEDWLFEKKTARVILAFDGDDAVGFALFFYNFSTWLGRAGIYLEDLFVLEEYRGQGVGKTLLKSLAKIAVAEGCGRLEWACLDWNEPSIAFYRAQGAVSMDELTTYRLTGEALLTFAEADKT
jgi:GNAT superfamily N-acetyltransferase